MDKVGRYRYNANVFFFIKRAHAVVGSYLPNAWGLYDMHGNVDVWCLDWYDDIAKGPSINPKGAKNGESRVLRGSNWSSWPSKCRSASRQDYFSDQVDGSNFFPEYSEIHLDNGCYGFRLALVQE